jgi:hypothetical protein
MNGNHVVREDEHGIWHPVAKTDRRSADRRATCPVSIPTAHVVGLHGAAIELRRTAATIVNQYPGNARYLNELSAQLDALANQANVPA